MIGIAIVEIKRYGMVVLVGVLSWFVFAGARDWFIETFPNISTFWIGLIGMLLLMMIYKYKGAIPFV